MKKLLITITVNNNVNNCVYLNIIGEERRKFHTENTNQKDEGQASRSE
jgi:hypothetical protein